MIYTQCQLHVYANKLVHLDNLQTMIPPPVHDSTVLTSLTSLSLFRFQQCVNLKRVTNIIFYCSHISGGFQCFSVVQICGLRIPMMSFVIIFLLIVWIFFKIMHTKVCSCVSSTYVLFSSIKTSAMVILLTLYLNQVHQLVDSKGNVQVLLLSLKHNDQRMCVGKAWTLSVCSRWFDKSVQFITYENGFCGVCGEHSSIDATVSRGTKAWGICGGIC